MTPEKILFHKAKVLTQAQREAYFRDGYLALEGFVDQDWLDRLWQVTEGFIEESRGWTKSDDKFDLEPNHSAESPRLRRLTWPVTHHPLYWEFASRGPIVDVAEDLLGPDVVFHHSKLNFKWGGGGEEVKWHQDISYWPHTNYSPLTIGAYIYDVGPDQAPLGVIPGSHDGELFDQYNDKDEWVGCLSDEQLERVALGDAEYLMGPAGSVTIHNCRTVHGSAPNDSERGRPLLLNAYSAADAFTYTANPVPSRHMGAIVRGKPARYAHHDPRPCQVPPDWSGGYTSLFALQQEEEWDADQLDAVASQTSAIRGKSAAE